MKGIVVEVRGKMVTVLGDDGSVENLRNKGYKVGEVIKMKESTFSLYKSQIRRFGAVAAAFVFFTAGAYAYSIPVAYVSVDINPSIEYELNIFDRVLSIKAMDESALEIVAMLDVKNMNIQKAVRLTTQQLANKGYIEGESNNIFVVAGSDDAQKAERLAEQLALRVQEMIDKEGKKAEVDAQAVSLARVEEAKALDVTPGKLNLVQKLIEIDEEYEEEDQPKLLEQSVKDINKEIKESRKDSEVKNQEKKEEAVQEITEEEKEESEQKAEEEQEIEDSQENEQKTDKKDKEEKEESQQRIDEEKNAESQQKTDEKDQEQIAQWNGQEVNSQKDPIHEDVPGKTDKEEKPKR